MKLQQYKKNYPSSLSNSPRCVSLFFLHLNRSNLVLDRCGSDCWLHIFRSKTFKEGLDFLRLPSRLLSCFVVK